MSHRFPQITAQYDLNQARRRRDKPTPVLTMALAEINCLPWFEMVLGAAFLMALGRFNWLYGHDVTRAR